MTYPVSNLRQAYNACNPDIPLPVGDVRYLDLTAVRGEEQNFVDMIATAIDLALDDNLSSRRYYRQLVTGHRGCGKSTELLRLQARLTKDGFFIVYFDVESLLNMGNVDYIDILLLIAHQVVLQLEKQDISLNSELLKDLHQWFADKVLSKNVGKETYAAVEAEGEIGATIPWFSKLLLRVNAGVRGSDTERTEIRNTLRREWYVFVEKLNKLLIEAYLKVRDQQYRDLVVIVDGLEKMFYEPLRDGGGNPTGESTHSLLFVKHAEQLTVPHCHLIYTVPISLVFNASLANAFDVDSPVVMPMVDVKKPAGVLQLIELVKKRVITENIFSDPALVENLVKMSGGAVRDLMRLIRLACLNAQTAQQPRISLEAVEQAIRALVREFDRLIQETDIVALKAVAETQRVTGEEGFARLLHNRVIHEYQNGERWADLHPAVREIKWVMEKIQSHDSR
jgi:hypothetical protein